MKTSVLCGIVAAAGMSLAAGANADTVFYNGVLDGNSPTFNNPNGAAGLQYYNVTEFTVDAAGAYTFEMSSPNTTGTPSNALDTNLRLYSNAFNPLDPGTGLVTFNDDFSGTLTVLPGPYSPTIGATATGFTGAQPSSRLLNVNLSTGISYFLVNTSFRETTFVGTGTTSQAVGPYYQGITGPGNITIIPAPGALALLGLGGLVATRRRR